MLTVGLSLGAPGEPARAGAAAPAFAGIATLLSETANLASGTAIGLPGGAAAGDFAVFLATNAHGDTTTIVPPAGFAPVAEPVNRAGTLGGQSYRMEIYGKAIAAADVAAGQVVTQSVLHAGRPVALVLVRPAGPVTVAAAAPNFTRVTATTDLPLARPTAPTPGLALSLSVRGGGYGATESLPDWATRAHVQTADPGQVALNAYALHVATRPVPAGLLAPAVLAWSGTAHANNNLTNVTLILVTE